MPQKPEDRDYKKEWARDKELGHKVKAHALRQKARDMYDKAGIDRKGKQIAHIKAISRGGTSDPKNLELESPEKNQHFKRNSDHTLKK